MSNSDVKLTHPVYDVDGAFVITPTNLGYRLTSGSELKDKNQPLTPTQLALVSITAHEALSLGEKTDAPIWMGNRPTLPDSLPVIGQSPQNQNLWLAFGHQHIGFSTGPTTGRLIAELIANEPTLIDTTPFSPARFIKNKAR
jgi:D-amino-acid dehydrogenase